MRRITTFRSTTGHINDSGPVRLYYEGKSLNNRKFYTRKNFFTRVLTESVYVLFFDIVPLLRNTLGPPVHKLADAL